MGVSMCIYYTNYSAMSSVQQKYDFAVLATDVVMFTVFDGKLQVLLIQMKKQPFAGKWALPGGLIRADEDANTAAKRHLTEKTGLTSAFLEQLYTFSQVDRDPFGRVVSVAYYALLSKPAMVATTKEYANVAWKPVKTIHELAYDHKQILTVAVQRLKSKLSYTNVVYSLLPKEFTLRELQTMYEIILDKPIDKRNFRKKVLSLGLVQKTGKKQTGGQNRPAELYAFTTRTLQEVVMI